MFSILIYAIASFYFIVSNLPAAANVALNFAKSVPIVQSTPLLLQVEKNLQTVILPSATMRATVSGVLSLLVYPLVMTVNEVVQFFVYWLALFGFCYLSLSQNPEMLQKVCGYASQAIQVLKAAAPEQFQSMLALTEKVTIVSLTQEKNE